MMPEFAWIWMLLALPLPALISILGKRTAVAAASSGGASLVVPFADFYNQLSAQESRNVSRKTGHSLLLWLIWILLVLAAARPQWVGEPVSLAMSGRDLMVAVDLSGSMEEKDFERRGTLISRLYAAKLVASEFINERAGDRIGLILFGTQPYMQTPLTYDLKTVQRLLGESVVGMAGQYTAIGDAIGLAIKRLKDHPADKRVLILMTDGSNTAGRLDPSKAADIAAEFGLKVYTIGIGADELLVRSLFGTRRINPSSDLDEKMLKEIADKTGGRYFRARNTEELRQIYALLDQLEPVEQDAIQYRPVKDLFYWPLGIALILMFVLLLTRREGALHV